MTILYLYIYFLLLWPIYEYLKGIFLVPPDEAKEWRRLQLKSRGNIIPKSINVREIALEAYDHLIIESLNYQTK